MESFFAKEIRPLGFGFSGASPIAIKGGDFNLRTVTKLPNGSGKKFKIAVLCEPDKIDEAKKIVKSATKLYPRNLLLNQYKLDLDKNKNISVFDCKKEAHVISEILYITANALSSQSIYALSNFYLNLAKFLNDDFHSYDTLLAENFYKINNYTKAKKIYNNLSKQGKAFAWYSSKQLAKIFLEEKKKDIALILVTDAYNSLAIKDIYETFDYAEFLKNNVYKPYLCLYNLITSGFARLKLLSQLHKPSKLTLSMERVYNAVWRICGET